MVLTSIMCSNLLIVSMTFQRFYGIIQPHKAVSFNTVKRAKIIIACIVTFSFIYRFPNLFTTKIHGRHCIIYGKILGEAYGQFYYWLTFVLNFMIPFVSLFVMNIVIINILHKRSQSSLMKSIRSQGQGHTQGQGHNENSCQGQVKNTDQQIYTMLLLVTFSYLVLNTPAYIMLLYINLVNPLQSPYFYAAYILFVQVGEKAQTTILELISFFMFYLVKNSEKTSLSNLCAGQTKFAGLQCILLKLQDKVEYSKMDNPDI